MLSASCVDRLGLPPRHVFRDLGGRAPLFLIDTVANEADGDFSRGFNLLPALGGTLHNARPAFVLLPAVWAHTGWTARATTWPWRPCAWDRT